MKESIQVQLAEALGDVSPAWGINTGDKGADDVVSSKLDYVFNSNVKNILSRAR